MGVFTKFFHSTKGANVDAENELVGWGKCDGRVAWRGEERRGDRTGDGRENVGSLRHASAVTARVYVDSIVPASVEAAIRVLSGLLPL